MTYPGGVTYYYQDDLILPEVLVNPVPMPAPGLSGKDLTDFLEQKVLPQFEKQNNRLCKLESWGQGKQPEVRPLKRNTERAVLQRLARTPWMKLMVKTFSQQLIVDGYHKDGAIESDTTAWQTWLMNDMPSQQFSINTAVLQFGYTYLRVTEGISPVDGSTMAVMKAVSPKRVFALYEDPYADEFPQYVLEKMPDFTWRWWLPNGDYYALTLTGMKFQIGELEQNDYGRVPFVRFVNEIDLDGRCWGEIEPYIDLAARIDKTAFDRLLVQHFNSFKVRWATGLEQADKPEDVEQDKIRLGHEDLLISSEATAKFGTLDETLMDGFISAYAADLQAFVAVLQLPPNLIGQVINVAADSLDAARRQTYQKLFEKQTIMGAKYGQALRLVAHIEGREEDATDFLARVHWQDPEVKSLAQFADAWGKIVSQLGVPKWAAWAKIPGVEQTEVETWKKHVLDMDPVSRYLREVVGVTTLNVGVDAKTGAPEPPPAAPLPPGGGFGGGAGKPPSAGPNNPKNQPPINNKTGVTRGSVTK